MDRNTPSNNFNNTWTFTKIKFTEGTTRNIASIRMVRLDKPMEDRTPLMGMVHPAQSGGEFLELAINVTNFAQNAMDKVHALTVLNLGLVANTFENAKSGARPQEKT